MTTKQKWLALVLFTGLLVGLTEAALRINWHLLTKRGSTSALFVELLSRTNERKNSIAPASQQLISVPYGLFRNNPEYVSRTEPLIRQHDEHGYRNPSYASNSGCFKILAYGGSTTNEYPYVKRSQSWTMKLRDMLEGKESIPNAKKCVDVYNAGLPYGTSAELVSDYVYRGRLLSPDLIIIHTGGNDGLALWQESYSTDYSHIRSSSSSNALQAMMSGDGKAPSILRTLSRKSAIARHFLFIIARSYPAGGVYNPAINGTFPLSPSDSLAKVQSRYPVAFNNNLETIIILARESSTPVLLVPFIQARKELLSRNRPDLIGYEELNVESVKKHSDVIQNLARSHTNAYVLNLNRARFLDEYFLDNCHLDPRGSLEKANQIYDAVLSLFKKDNLFAYKK